MTREEAMQLAQEKNDRKRQEGYDQCLQEEYDCRLEEKYEDRLQEEYEVSETDEFPTLPELKRRMELCGFALMRAEIQRVPAYTLQQLQKEYLQALDDYKRKKRGGKR